MAQLVTAWSYSRYDKYTTCPLWFKLDVIDKVAPVVQSDAMARGDRIHKTLAKYITGDEPEMPAEVKLPFQRELVEQLRAWPAEDKVVEQQWAFTSTWKPTEWFAKDAWYRSVLDVGVAYPDDTLEDIDWKSGKRYGSNDEQMESQGVSVFAKYPHIKHVITRLVYLDGQTEEFAEFPVKDREKLQAKWEVKAAPMFVDETFAPRPNEKCRFCPHARSKTGRCRFG